MGKKNKLNKKIYNSIFFITIFLFLYINLYSQKLLIQMDISQTNHLKAYGIVFWSLEKGDIWDWLLNYRGGSFMTDYQQHIVNECRIRGIDFQTITDDEAYKIYSMIQSEGVNMDVVKLEKAPKIAVYVQPGNAPWDDAVRMVLEYAEVKYDAIWDEEVLNDKLSNYDWLHLHHEDFTGQYGKFWAKHRHENWYIQQVTLNENTAQKLGYKKVSEMKKATVRKIREFVANGGFLFAMCTATDTYDIALSAEDVDICAEIYDGDQADPKSNDKLDYSKTMAFENYTVYTNPMYHPFSDIDVGVQSGIENQDVDYFTLFEFSAKYDPIPTMLTQCHVNVIKGFLGQTTAFYKNKIKKYVNILAEKEGTDEVKYIQGHIGRGFFCWYGGHDPEDYQHFLGDPPTNLELYKTSPGYRLILNNILFPAAKKKTQKT